MKRSLDIRDPSRRDPTLLKRPRVWGPVAACLGLAVGASACGAAAPTAKVHHQAQTNGPTYEVKGADVDGLGTALVDGKGITLYLFVPDDHSMHSTCSGICSVAWPPLLLPQGVTAPLAGHGIEAPLLGTTIRADGSVQITYNGWPLYLWPNDTEPGQATGQGLNNLGGLWYIVSPMGDPIHK